MRTLVNPTGPIATVLKTNAPLFIKDVATSNLQRKDLAIKYGIGQIAFVPFEGGILEFGTSNGASTADWKEMPQCPTMPKAAMRRGFENLGASYNIFWAKKGDKFEAIADYTTEARKVSLKICDCQQSTESSLPKTSLSVQHSMSHCWLVMMSQCPQEY